MRKQTLSQRKALRSAAAKKGWETRRANRRQVTSVVDYGQITKEMQDKLLSIFHPPKPSLWQRIKGWFA